MIVASEDLLMLKPETEWLDDNCKRVLNREKESSGIAFLLENPKYLHCGLLPFY